MAKNYVRMISPDGLRKVDICPLSVVPEKRAAGWTVDPFPDDRPEIQSSLPGRHKGRTAFVAGSGPSMGTTPIERIHDFIQDHNCVVYGCNNIYEVCGGRQLQGANYLVINDDHFYAGNRGKVLGYLRDNPGCLLCIPFTLNENVRFHELKIKMSRTCEPGNHVPYNPGEYFHGQSSGIVAIQMAMQAGCETIYLLGHDLTTAGNMTHGSGKRTDAELNGKYPQGDMMRPGYAMLRKHADALGTKIINLSPISTIESFDRIPI